MSRLLVGQSSIRAQTRIHPIARIRIHLHTRIRIGAKTAVREVPANTCTSHNPPRKGTWARDHDSYQQPTHQTNTARVRRPLGHSGGGPPLDTCAQPAATPHPSPEGPGTPSDGAARSPELSFGARRRGAPSLGLGAPGFIFISKLLRESTSKPSSKKQLQIHICSLKSWSVVCTIVVLARAGKSTADRPSASTHIQDQDPSQVQEPGGDRETFQEKPLTQHTPVRDAKNVIELNQYKYTNVPVVEEHMANLTSHELAEAIRLYRDEKARAQIEFEQDDEQEESGDSQQSRRSVFDRIGAKAKKNQKEPSKKETEATRKKKLEEIREKIRKEEEEKLE
ncbi:hypothetical protein AgCh_016068 [Apium graveolens]